MNLLIIFLEAAILAGTTLAKGPEYCHRSLCQNNGERVCSEPGRNSRRSKIIWYCNNNCWEKKYCGKGMFCKLCFERRNWPPIDGPQVLENMEARSA
ncbi:hypothetical protein GQ44DRAFT_698624 [Phaeosphaeriaceae sp. PMI808]|nr:hypothetical protein GQ44DRAFT_698624 [Phaeosphaeriaceae sp. PMI808]